MVVNAAVYSPNEQPVYVNPNLPKEALVVPTPVQQNANIVTQTVYGFLDFTTTIGNTVMVFSPQSAAVVTEPPTTTTTTTEQPLIETRPITPEPKEEILEIKPSKPINEPQTIHSVVAVMAESSEETTNPPITPKSTPLKVPKLNKPSPGKPVTIKPKADSEQKVFVISSNVQVVEATSPTTPAPKIIVEPVVSVIEPEDDENESDEEENDAQEDFDSESEFEDQDEEEEIIPEVITSSSVHQSEEKPVIYSSVVEALSSTDDAEPVLQISNNIGEPEYDFLSRQPTEFVEETYRVVNLKPTTTRPKTKKTSQPKNADTHPTGLVTKLGGTVVKDGVTTVHETSVIGTYISGKYAQVLQSTSHVFQNNVKPKISPSSTLRILKTAAPHLPKASKHSQSESHQSEAVLPVESLFGTSSNPLVRSSRKPASSTSSFKNRFKSKPSKEEDTQEYEEIVTPSQVTPSFGSGKKGSSSRRTLGKGKT